MDSITQIALGASVGEAYLGRKVGNRAPLWGAIGGTIPDLDVIPGLFLDTVQRLDIHRGFSHSIIFFLLLSPVLAWLIQKLYKDPKAGYWHWTVFFFLVLVTHPLLDCFTTWGTQLFWPWDYRIAWNTIFVIDPLYTLPLLISMIIVLFKKGKTRQVLVWSGLAISSCYLFFTVLTKFGIENTFKKALADQDIEFQRLLSRPAPLSSLLWSGIAETEDGFYFGYYSVLDKNEEVNFHYYAKNEHLLNSELLQYYDLQRLLFLTKGYYTLEAKNENIILHDLRFGELNGWIREKSQFVFSYIIMEDGQLNIKEISPELRLNSENLGVLWDRIKGE